MLEKELYQQEIREWIEGLLGNEIMIPVFGPYNKKNMDIYFQSYLIPVEKAVDQLNTDTYDIHSSLLPGFTQYGAWEDSEVVYNRYNSNINAEPFVIVRDYHGLADEEYEIVEEFRLLFNLYYNRQSQELIDLEEEVIVVKINENKSIHVNKKYLKRYLAIKKMALILHIDSRYIFEEYNDSIKNDSFSFRNSENTMMYNLNIFKTKCTGKPQTCSILYGKKIIYGCALSDCGIWPYSEKKEFESFIIGVDDDGNEIYNTSNPDELSNYFGANPTAPHYLTPVYFDSGVLNKYYSKPEKYEVGDCIIRCGTLWSLYIDNQNKGYVSVYLGDLGRDLPSKREQLYWKSYNKAIDGKLSHTKFQRDFMASFTNPEAIDFIFKNTYIKTNKIFEEKLGWKLFLDLDKQDIYNFEGLRIPINNSIVEMDILTLSLVKVLLDSLNEKNIVKDLTGNYEKLAGSISKLEVWIKEKNLVDYQDHIKFLRNLQELRSSGTGHRKGKGYEKISKKFDISKGNYNEAFINILEQAVEFLNYMVTNVESFSLKKNNS